MSMSRKYVFPDPDDRSKNDPNTIVDSKKVLGIYNQEHIDEEDMQKVTQKVQDWFKDKAEQMGWDEVSFSGGQCILKNSFTK